MPPCLSSRQPMGTSFGLVSGPCHSWLGYRVSGLPAAPGWGFLRLWLGFGSPLLLPFGTLCFAFHVHRFSCTVMGLSVGGGHLETVLLSRGRGPSRTLDILQRRRQH